MTQINNVIFNAMDKEKLIKLTKGKVSGFVEKARKRKELRNNGVLDDVIGRLECLMRYDFFIDNEDNIQEDYNPLTGEYIKWDDLIYLIKELKKENAL